MAKFKTSARTVDMLGRQQIAGIPTAMSELFKNAYDAYATEVRADYVPGLRTLILRDNGVGMSESDFLSRWLTLGTDSKAAGGTFAPTQVPLGLRERRQMGEKGIGRLAIASIAPLVLIVTRSESSKTRNGVDEVTASLIPWAIFETPGLTLDEIEIPVISTSPRELTLRQLFATVAELLDELLLDMGPRIGEERFALVLDQLEQARSISMDFVPSLDGPNVLEASGTTFVLFGTNEDLEAAVQTEPDGEQVSEFQRFLGGFTNSISKPESESPIRTRFVIHDETGERDLIGSGTFWRQRDFDLVDHVIGGNFHPDGTFVGTVGLYGGKSIPYTLGWGVAGRSPRCGPFKLSLGVLQGDPKESRLPADEFVLMSRRLRAQGGLYIYRDDIRVLPYGNSDVDYLEIEKRRTLNAGRYYFSHRRIFGAIELSAASNPGLQEKAGREGFRQNAAYRDFVTILENFLQQVALDFFRSGGAHHDEFQAQRDVLTSRSKARQQKERAEATERDKFATEMYAAIEQLQRGSFVAAVGDLKERHTQAATDLRERNADSHAWESLLNQLKQEERELARSIVPRRPQSLALTAEQDRDYDSWQHLANGARALLRETVDGVTGYVTALGSSAGLNISAEVGAAQYLADYAAEILDAVSEDGETTRADIAQVSNRLLTEVAEIVTRAQEDVQQLTLNTAVTASPASARAVEERMELIADNSTRRVAAIRDTVNKMFYDRDILLDHRHLQERVLDLESEADNNVELMQLGLSVQLLDHELEGNITAVRSGLRRLQPWARANEQLSAIVEDLRTAFHHLDGYLRMFTPLQRRLYRSRVAFNGADLLRFCRGVFDERLRQHNIELTATDQFRRFAIFGYPSSFYPVFLNLIDNAIHWVQESNRPRTILLDATADGLSISDSGPGIAASDRSAVFERGFSRRRGGRGLGLALASEILAREGWSLEASSSVQLGGAQFIARRTKGEDQNDVE